MMKRLTMCFAGALLVLSLAACTPTQVKSADTASEPSAQESAGGANDKVPDPNVEPMEVISVYSPNNEATGLNQAMDAVDELTAQALVDKLVEYGVLEEGTTVVKFDTADGVGTLDISKLPESKDAAEKMMLTAIGNTFTENFELTGLKLLVNGEAYSGAAGSSTLEYIREYKKL